MDMPESGTWASLRRCIDGSPAWQNVTCSELHRFCRRYGGTLPVLCSEMSTVPRPTLTETGMMRKLSSVWRCSRRMPKYSSFSCGLYRPLQHQLPSAGRNTTSCPQSFCTITSGCAPPLGMRRRRRRRSSWSPESTPSSASASGCPTCFISMSMPVRFSTMYLLRTSTILLCRKGVSVGPGLTSTSSLCSGGACSRLMAFASAGVTSRFSIAAGALSMRWSMGAWDADDLLVAAAGREENPRGSSGVARVASEATAVRMVMVFESRLSLSSGVSGSRSGLAIQKRVPCCALPGALLGL
mmetsp:Transcript_2912/g.7249  ORF Transcript_2912/g.7249 Transcript_2912/m.7249 type:complete len:298 (+) Transcript_2912:791-1684(+)